MWVSIKQIKVSAKQLRKLDKNKIERHRKAFESGAEVMPIDVVEISSGQYCICGNGRHRFFGAISAGHSMIEINILNEQK